MNRFGTQRGGKRSNDRGNQLGALPFSLDCFCVFCGTKVANQAIRKDAKCPNKNCLMPVPARTAPSQKKGWVRCSLCDRFTHPDHFFCTNCGEVVTDGKEGFVTARRKLMAKNPGAVAEGKQVSLADLGGVEMFATPKKKVQTKLVVVYPKPLDPFDAEGDKTLGNIDDTDVSGASVPVKKKKGAPSTFEGTDVITGNIDDTDVSGASAPVKKKKGAPSTFEVTDSDDEGAANRTKETEKPSNTE